MSSTTIDNISPSPLANSFRQVIQPPAQPLHTITKPRQWLVLAVSHPLSIGKLVNLLLKTVDKPLNRCD
jgi:hypothetical protein